MAAIVADTHAAVWYLLNAKSLSSMPDRIVAATALDLGLRLVTRDSEISKTGIEIVW